MTMPLGEGSPFYIDITNGQLLVGHEVIDAHIEAGGHPADIRHLNDLLNNPLPKTVSFAENNKGPLRWEKLTREDFLEYGKWLMQIMGKADEPLSVRNIEVACRLGLGPGRQAIISTGGFNSVPQFQYELNSKKIIWYDAFQEWDDLDLLIHLRNVGEEEKRRPSMPIIAQRTRDGRKEPAVRFIRKRMPLAEAYEKAGYVYPREWGKDQYAEWGYAFYIANGRTPIASELTNLSLAEKGPSPTGVYALYGSMAEFQGTILEMAEKRESKKIQEIRDEMILGTVPRELFSEPLTAEETLRITGRYKIIGDLLPSNNTMQRISISRYDVIGDDFVQYLQLRDERIQDWLVEASARWHLFYSDLFPSGSFINSLKVLEK